MTLLNQLDQISSDISECTISDDYESESLDPRIQVELERLNKSSADINKLEKELDDAKSLFNQSRSIQLQRLEMLQKKYGSCITKAKPYYEALTLTERLQTEAQKAVQEYQRASSLYKTAKETLSVAEHNLASGEIPAAWQEHISTTITKINTSKKSVDQAEECHRRKTLEYKEAEERCQFLERELKKHIEKSQLYYEEKAQWNRQMQAQKNRIEEWENELIVAKKTYKEAMINLSKISEEIHTKRSLEKCSKNSSPSESDVGAENQDSEQIN